MIRRELWVPLAVVAVTVAFIAVSALVRVSGGNPWLIRRKLRIGALLLGLTWSASGCDDEGVVTCYDPIPPEHVELDQQFWGDYGYRLDLAAGHVLTGSVLFRTSEIFSFQLRDATEVEVRRGALSATDGVFDASTEAISLDVGADLPPGSYQLRFYGGDVDHGNLLVESPLTVVAGS